MADGDPLDEYGLDGARVDPLDAYRRPQPLTLDSPPPPRDPPRRSYGKGSVQMMGDPNPYGQHNLLTRGASDLASALNPFTAAYDIGHNILGPAIEERSPAGLGLGAGALGLAALPFGVAARRVTFTPEMRETARRMYFAENVPLELVAERVGVNRSTLRRHFADEGLEVRPPAAGNPRNRRDDLPPAEELRELHRQGASYGELAERFGISQPALHARLSAIGYTPGSPRRDPALVEQVERLRHQGLSFNEIGMEVHRSRDYVRDIVRSLRRQGRPVPAFLAAMVGADMALTDD